MHYLYSSGVSGVDGVPLSDVLAFASGFFTFGAFAFVLAAFFFRRLLPPQVFPDGISERPIQNPWRPRQLGFVGPASNPIISAGALVLTKGYARSETHPCALIRTGNAMEKFTTLEGVAAPLKMINVDTDMIIPKQYLKTIKRTGLGKGLFSEKRYRDDGSENPDFVLNKPAYRKAKILVTGDNFGCGSSREHAPWALMDFGIRCVISTSFGDIFYNNCFKNGILPVQVTPEDLEKLFDDAERGANATMTIDLEKQEIRGPDGGVVKFDIDPHRKHCLLDGLDDIGLTMIKKDKIDSYESKMKSARPWA